MTHRLKIAEFDSWQIYSFCVLIGSMFWTWCSLYDLHKYFVLCRYRMPQRRCCVELWSYSVNCIRHVKLLSALTRTPDSALSSGASAGLDLRYDTTHGIYCVLRTRWVADLVYRVTPKTNTKLGNCRDSSHRSPNAISWIYLFRPKTAHEHRKKYTTNAKIT